MEIKYFCLDSSRHLFSTYKVPGIVVSTIHTYPDTHTCAHTQTRERTYTQDACRKEEVCKLPYTLIKGSVMRETDMSSLFGGAT